MRARLTALGPLTRPGKEVGPLIRLAPPNGAIAPEFGATFASSQVEGSAARKCFHYA
jgi:hypothetical protein